MQDADKVQSQNLLFIGLILGRARAGTAASTQGRTPERVGARERERGRGEQKDRGEPDGEVTLKENGAAKPAATGKSSTRSKPQVVEKETERAGYQKPTQVDFILILY